MAGLQIEAPPDIEPVSLATLKSHLRVTIADDDELIKIYQQCAREDVEDFLERSLVNKRYIQTLDSFPYFTDSMMSQQAYPPSYYALPRYSTTLWNYSQMIKLLVSPLVKGDLWIEYTDTNGVDQKIYPALENWEPDTEYQEGDQIEDPNGNVQEVTAVQEPVSDDEEAEVTSGSTTPAWNATTGQTTTDGPLTWTNGGTAPAGSFFYDRVSEPPRLFPAPAGQFWPPVLYVPNAVRIHFTAGYGIDAVAVPARAKVAIMQLVANWYENREPAGSPELKKLPHHLERILWGLRVLDFSPTRG